VGLLLTLWMIFSPSDYAHAGEDMIQESPAVDPIMDPVVIVVITTESIEAQIQDAQDSLEAGMSTEGQAIINEIISNAGVSEQEATEIATTQEPIASTVEVANTEIQEAQEAITDANTAVDLVKDAEVAVEE